MGLVSEMPVFTTLRLGRIARRVGQQGWQEPVFDLVFLGEVSHADIGCASFICSRKRLRALVFVLCGKRGRTTRVCSYDTEFRVGAVRDRALYGG